MLPWRNLCLSPSLQTPAIRPPLPSCGSRRLEAELLPFFLSRSISPAFLSIKCVNALSTYRMRKRNAFSHLLFHLPGNKNAVTKGNIIYFLFTRRVTFSSEARTKYFFSSSLAQIAHLELAYPLTVSSMFHASLVIVTDQAAFYPNKTHFLVRQSCTRDRPVLFSLSPSLPFSRSFCRHQIVFLPFGRLLFAPFSFLPYGPYY